MTFHNDSTMDWYHYYFTELSDKRTIGWFLMRDPIFLAIILVFYLSFVLKWGPEFMKNRKPFIFTNVLTVYNFCQVILSLYLATGLIYSFFTDNDWKCSAVNHSFSSNAIFTAKMFHVYFIAKLTELLDTVFFILRKKERQVSFLHVYHHTFMAIYVWVAVKYIPGGQGSFTAGINSFVHIIMYSYYMLAALGPQYQKYIWWKKYITKLQLVQFVLVLLHNLSSLISNCGYPVWASTMSMTNSALFLALFTRFYVKSYNTNSKHK